MMPGRRQRCLPNRGGEWLHGSFGTFVWHRVRAPPSLPYLTSTGGGGWVGTRVPAATFWPSPGPGMAWHGGRWMDGWIATFTARGWTLINGCWREIHQWPSCALSAGVSRSSCFLGCAVHRHEPPRRPDSHCQVSSDSEQFGQRAVPGGMGNRCEQPPLLRPIVGFVCGDAKGNLVCLVLAFDWETSGPLFWWR